MRWKRVPGATGDELLGCAPTLEFAVVVELQTADGTFDASWTGEASADLLIDGPPMSVEIDAVAAGIPESLAVTPNPQPPRPLFDPRYVHRILYGKDAEGKTRLEGSIQYVADFEETRDGEIIDGGGVFLRLATWAGGEE